MTTTISSPRSRVSAGVPQGGQFSTENRPESAVALVPFTGAGTASADESIVDKDTVFTAKYAGADAKVKALREELNKSIVELASDEDYLRFLATAAKFHRYSFTNQFLIHLQTNGRATRVAGFNKWKELGRSVKKGEKGITIFAPKIVNTEVKDAAGNKVMGPNGKPLRERRMVGTTPATVFDVSQTQGDPLPEFSTELTETPPAGHIEDLEAVIAAEGFTVRYEPLEPGLYGSTSKRRAEVVIDSNLSEGDRAHTLAHELAHIKAGHLDRIDEYHSGPGGCRGEIEVQAESIAFVIGRAAGMSTSLNRSAAHYVASWAKADPQVIQNSANIVAKTSKDLITSGAFRNIVE